MNGIVTQSATRSRAIGQEVGGAWEHELRVECVRGEDDAKLYECQAVNEAGESKTSAKIYLQGLCPHTVIIYSYKCY